MNLQHDVQRLTNAVAYKDFQKKHKDAYIAAGFFVLDYESGKNLHQIDYYVPSQKKVAAFTLDRQITMQLLDVINEKVPEKLDTKAKIDLDALYGILEDEMKNRSITEEIKKIIAVVQKIEGKKIWNLNCVLSGMSILNAHIDDDSETVLKMERKSIVDYLRRIPGAMSPAIPQQEAAPAVPKEGSDIEEKIKKLQELETAIAKEKEALLKSKSSAMKPAAAPTKSASLKKQTKQKK